MKRSHTYSRQAALLSLALLAAAPAIAGNSAPAAAAQQKAVFARVGDAVISRDEYIAAYSAAARGKFYHGKPPEGGEAALQREVGDQLVARVLLLREARQRGIKPDQAVIQKTIQGYEQRYAGSAQWKQIRDKALPGLTARLEEDSLLAQLEKAVRAVPAPAQKEVKAYYAAHQDKFTEPEQLRVSVILLKVDPSSPSDAWVKANEQAQAIVRKLQGGADFAELARKQSADESALRGGDMGYLHAGMLPEGTQQVLNAMKPGEISNPVQVLEGMAVLRLADRKPARLNSFETVQQRAQELLQRDQQNEAWGRLIAELKKKTPAQIDQSLFLPLAESSGARPAAK